MDIFPNKDKVKIETKVDDFIIDINILSPMGIIINELIANAMKHAFQNSDNGLIFIETRIENIEKTGNGKMITLIIQDNGSGLDESIDVEKTVGFGLKLIDLLVKQLKGTICIERGHGTKFIMNFEI
jgi:two-component sensor histidine kinase